MKLSMLSYGSSRKDGKIGRALYAYEAAESKLNDSKSQ